LSPFSGGGRTWRRTRRRRAGVEGAWMNGWASNVTPLYSASPALTVYSDTTTLYLAGACALWFMSPNARNLGITAMPAEHQRGAPATVFSWVLRGGTNCVHPSARVPPGAGDRTLRQQTTRLRQRAACGASCQLAWQGLAGEMSLAFAIRISQYTSQPLFTLPDRNSNKHRATKFSAGRPSE